MSDEMIPPNGGVGPGLRPGIIVVWPSDPLAEPIFISPVDDNDGYEPSGMDEFKRRRDVSTAASCRSFTP